ncbi:MAG: hypothetical protein ACLPJH_06605, partial [Myxococcaceae bacterium]
VRDEVRAAEPCNTGVDGRDTGDTVLDTADIGDTELDTGETMWGNLARLYEVCISPNHSTVLDPSRGA